MQVHACARPLCPTRTPFPQHLLPALKHVLQRVRVLSCLLPHVCVQPLPASFVYLVYTATVGVSHLPCAMAICWCSSCGAISSVCTCRPLRLKPELLPSPAPSFNALGAHLPGCVSICWCACCGACSPVCTCRLLCFEAQLLFQHTLQQLTLTTTCTLQ